MARRCRRRRTAPPRTCGSCASRSGGALRSRLGQKPFPITVFRAELAADQQVQFNVEPALVPAVPSLGEDADAHLAELPVPDWLKRKQSTSLRSRAKKPRHAQWIARRVVIT